MEVGLGVLYGKSFTESESVYGIVFTKIKVIRHKVYNKFYHTDIALQLLVRKDLSEAF